MPRAIRLAPLALVAGCAGHPHVEPGPPGLAYTCNGEPLMIVYGDGGYIPGATGRAPQGAAPRSRAQLTFRGRQVDLVADNAFTDLRYVTSESDGAVTTGDVAIIWSARGDTATLQHLVHGASLSSVECRRVRTVTPTAPADAPGAHPAA